MYSYEYDVWVLNVKCIYRNITLFVVGYSSTETDRNNPV